MAFDPEALGDEMWTVVEGSITSPAMQRLYTTLVTQIHGELTRTPGAGVIEAMIAERVVFVYVYLRDREARVGEEGGFAHDRQHKEHNQLWHTMAVSLSKMSTAAKSDEQIRKHVLQEVVKHILAAIETFPKDSRMAIVERIEMAFADVDF